MGKILKIYCDGTGNGEGDIHPTNVRKIRDALSPENSYYFEGPGNDEDNILDWIAGNAFGLGMYETRNKAVEIIKENYVPGDKIIVIGFSRGAAEARMICHVLGEMGIEVDFLGCFDTVFARLPFGGLQQEPLFGDLHVSPLVKVARHAVARDEDRVAFTPNLMNARAGVGERWFRGNHANTGGGYKDCRLSNFPLVWMMDEMAKVVDVSFNNRPHITLPMKLAYEGLPIHREEMIGPREARRFGVQEDDQWTAKWPARYPNV